MFILLDDIPIDLIRKEIYKEIYNLIYVFFLTMNLIIRTYSNIFHSNILHSNTKPLVLYRYVVCSHKCVFVFDYRIHLRFNLLFVIRQAHAIVECFKRILFSVHTCVYTSSRFSSYGIVKTKLLVSSIKI